jgi:hypothetical protein
VIHESPYSGLFVPDHVTATASTVPLTRDVLPTGRSRQPTIAATNLVLYLPLVGEASRHSAPPATMRASVGRQRRERLHRACKRSHDPIPHLLRL